MQSYPFLKLTMIIIISSLMTLTFMFLIIALYCRNDSFLFTRISSKLLRKPSVSTSSIPLQLNHRVICMNYLLKVSRGPPKIKCSQTLPARKSVVFALFHFERYFPSPSLASTNLCSASVYIANSKERRGSPLIHDPNNFQKKQKNFDKHFTLPVDFRVCDRERFKS